MTQHAEKRDDLSSTVAQELLVQPEHDVIEKVVVAEVCMCRLLYVCADQIQT
jgi:hypothetical protein